jgi:hypothetical protein
MPDCDKCGTNCKTSKYLIKDKKINSNLCAQEYISVSNITENKDEYELLLIKYSNLQENLKNKDLYIVNLHIQLQYEQMKNKIYTNIIQSQTNINLVDIIKESEKEVHIFNFENGNIPIVVHEFTKQNIHQNNTDLAKKKTKFIKEEQRKNSIESDVVMDEEKKKKKTYHKVPDSVKTSEKEFGNKLKEVVVLVDKKIDKIVYDNFDVSHKEITESLEKLFETITNSRVYTVSLSHMKSIRKKLLGKLSLKDYVSLLHNHIKRLENIFSQRTYQYKKICKIIASTLTPLDMRLAYYEGYTNVNIEIDEVQKFGLALEILTKHQKQFVSYDKQSFIEDIKNYSLSLFELSDCVERCLINRYSFHNIIYLELPKSTKKDPYSFYTLEKVNEKRFWKMECRLEDFSSDLSDTVLPYCISLFRKLYKDVFNDNIYRQDYMDKSTITEFDCEQLLLNIILLSQPMGLCSMLQELVVNKSTFTPTESDKFNFHVDDKLQQKRFSSTVDDYEDTSQVIKRLFDGINKEDVMNIINSR